MLDTSGEQIIVLDAGGAFVTSVGEGIPITDFSTCGNQSLDVLYESEVIEYTLPDFSVRKEISLQTDGITLTELQRRDGEALLVYDRSGKRHRLVPTVAGGPVFPLGVIHNGINYYCCATRHLGRYVLPEDRTAPENAEYILLKYTL